LHPVNCVINMVHVTTWGHTELFQCPLFYRTNRKESISGYKISGWHSKQCYDKNWLCYSDHIKAWLSKDHPLIFTLALRAKKKTIGTISQFVHWVCEGGS